MSRDRDDAPPAAPALRPADVAGAERLAGLRLTPAEREALLDRAERFVHAYRARRAAPLDNAAAPALAYDPRAAGRVAPPAQGAAGGPLLPEPGPRPNDREALAFAPLPRLAAWLRSGRVSSMELTELALARLERHGPTLACVVTLTRELALEQAARADRELAEGRPRGPLHGIPYGLKDLFAVPGYPTTWGAAPYRAQRRPETATVYARLEAAGAVLAAKLSVGALAMGDVWFGGRTRNPYDPTEGSSGSSAGSAAAVAAGLVPFAIGTETLGSIVSPAARCGVTGLRPTFGRVSRHGAMALAWSMDKVGPMARTAEGCALVFDAIRGPDPRDPTVVAAPFPWPPADGLAGLRLGVVRAAFEEESPGAAHDAAVLAALEGAGARLVDVALPEEPVEPFYALLMAEAAAAFDELTRSDQDDELTEQGPEAWPNLLRAARFIPAVEYLQADRLRARVLRATEALFERVDAYLCPTGHPRNLVLTNATGHPAAVFPHAVEDGRPLDHAMTVTAPLDREDVALAVARAWQRHAGPPPPPRLDGDAAP